MLLRADGCILGPITGHTPSNRRTRSFVRHARRAHTAAGHGVRTGENWGSCQPWRGGAGDVRGRRRRGATDSMPIHSISQRSYPCFSISLTVCFQSQGCFVAKTDDENRVTPSFCLQRGALQGEQLPRGFPFLNDKTVCGGLRHTLTRVPTWQRGMMFTHIELLENISSIEGNANTRYTHVIA